MSTTTATAERHVDRIREVLDDPSQANSALLAFVEVATLVASVDDTFDLAGWTIIAADLAFGVALLHRAGVAVPEAAREFLLKLGLTADFAANLQPHGLI